DGGHRCGPDGLARGGFLPSAAVALLLDLVPDTVHHRADRLLPVDQSLGMDFGKCASQPVLADRLSHHVSLHLVCRPAVPGAPAPRPPRSPPPAGGPSGSLTPCAGRVYTSVSLRRA